MSEKMESFYGREIEIGNRDKVFFPDSGITKGDLIDYYARVAEIMLPYAQNRPLSMHRFPDGLEGYDFYQQEAPDYFPDWIDRVTVEKEGGHVTHVVCNEPTALVYLADQGCITPHIWLSRTGSLRQPDYVLFDLDPPEDSEDFAPVREAARRVRDRLSKLDLVPFIMTTGSTGFHVVAPLKRGPDFDTVRRFAGRVAEKLAEQYPDSLTTEQRKAKRGSRVYLDTVRNSYGHTRVAPYAVRARSGAPIATPIDWDELDGLHPRRYTIANIFRRLGQKADPWKDMMNDTRPLDMKKTE